MERDKETGNFIFSQNYKKTHLNSNNTLVKDFRLKIEVNNFQIDRTRSLNQSSENIELKINNSELVSRVRDLGTNKDIPCIDLQIQVDNKYRDETIFHMSFERDADRIKLDIILKDNTLIEKLLKILEASNRPSILNIEINLQGIEGLYPVIASYDNVVSKEIQPEFDIGVLHESSIVNFPLELKESLTIYYNHQLRIHTEDRLSFSIFDVINNNF